MWPERESAPRPRVLIVDDEAIMRVTLEDRFRMEGFEAITAPDIGTARRILSGQRIDLVVTDIRLPDGDGRDLFREICRTHPGVPVVVMTAYISVPDAVALTKAGAVDYLTKPFDMDDLIAKSARAIERAQDLGRAPLVALDGSNALPGSGVLGRSAAMRRIEEIAARIRDVDCSVLITGESGVGKEVVARFIHANSAYARGPFIAVDFATMAQQRLSAALFGEVREDGARRPGRFEQAQGGTLFLDEVDEIPEALQLKLLRVLQEREVVPVGGDRPVSLDFRVISAAQSDLETRIHDGLFRGDLYYRLNVLSIEIPPLRTRREDICPLARRFAADAASSMNRRVDGLSAGCEELLVTLDFPGNVRELRNMIESAVALSNGPRIQPHDLPRGGAPRAAAKDATNAPEELRKTVEHAERKAIMAALEHSGQVLNVAAKTLGISRKTLWEKMRRYGIERP